MPESLHNQRESHSGRSKMKKLKRIYTFNVRHVFTPSQGILISSEDRLVIPWAEPELASNGTSFFMASWFTTADTIVLKFNMV